MSGSMLAQANLLGDPFFENITIDRPITRNKQNLNQTFAHFIVKQNQYLQLQKKHE